MPGRGPRRRRRRAPWKLPARTSAPVVRSTKACWNTEPSGRIRFGDDPAGVARARRRGGRGRCSPRAAAGCGAGRRSRAARRAGTGRTAPRRASWGSGRAVRPPPRSSSRSAACSASERRWPQAAGVRPSSGTGVTQARSRPSAAARQKTKPTSASLKSATRRRSRTSSIAQRACSSESRAAATCQSRPGRKAAAQLRISR